MGFRERRQNKKDRTNGSFIRVMNLQRRGTQSKGLKEENKGKMKTWILGTVI